MCTIFRNIYVYFKTILLKTELIEKYYNAQQLTALQMNSQIKMFFTYKSNRFFSKPIDYSETLVMLSANYTFPHEAFYFIIFGQNSVAFMYYFDVMICLDGWSITSSSTKGSKN